MTLPTIVDVNVIIQSASVTQAGFGTVLIAGTNAPVGWGATLIKEFASLAEMVTDGWATSDPEYLAVASIFAQAISPTTVKVGDVGTFAKQDNNVDVTAAADGSYVCTINGTAFTFAAVGSTDALISAGLFALINAGSEPVTATDNTGDFDVEADDAGESFTITVTSPGDALVLTTTLANAGYGEGLTAIAAQDNDFYGLVGIDNDDFHIIERAAWVETQQKIHIAQSLEAGILLVATTTDIMSQLQDLSRQRTAVFYHASATEYLAAAICGNRLAVDADTQATVWSGVKLSGITKQNLTTTAQSSIEGKSGNHYGELGGNGHTSPGWMADGTYIDVMVAADWLQARLTERHIGRLQEHSNAGKKIPYDNDGIALVEADVRAIVRQGIDAQHLSEGTEGDDADPVPTYNFPTRATAIAADVSNRIYRYTATVAAAGAIINVVGTVYLTT